MGGIVNLAKLCQEFFGETANNLSITTGFIKRQRKITGSAFLKAIVFGNMSDSNCSLDGMRNFLSEETIDISAQGLDFRFTEVAVKFMQSMYEQCLKLFRNTMTLDCNILQQFNSVKLLDSSHVILPANMADMYKGCGACYKGRSSTVQSSLKLQVVFDYLNQSLETVDITGGIRADQGYREHLSNIYTKDLLISDLGYFVPASFIQIIELGVYFISRYKADTNIYDPITEEKIDLLNLLDNKFFLSKDVLLGKQAKVKLRIICHKLTDEQAIGRRRKANLLAKSHKYKSSSRKQRLLDWSIFITNISEDMVNAEHIMIIYRARWQIELLFKLYKSHAKIENLKGRSKSARVLCELYGKLCSVLIFHGLSNCVELANDREISLTKAFIELQKRSRELFLSITGLLNDLKQFLKKLIIDWGKFSLKDKYRKTRLSSLNTLKLLTIMA